MVTLQPAPTAVRPCGLDHLAGLVVEVSDLATTRAFYAPIFDTVAGAWEETRTRLTFRTGGQRVAFVRRRRPRTLGHTGQHQAYHVPADRVPRLVEALAANHAVEWWREDHPAERQTMPYLHDPSGNRVQLVPAGAAAPLIAHAAFEVHDVELAETFYVRVLGGEVDYYHGWAMDDYVEAKAWADGRDPCAPWTRRWDVRYWDKVRLARPNMQLFVRFGSGRLGLILAREHRQEPPEEVRKGTPRVVLGTPWAVDEVQASLMGLRLPFLAEGRSLFLRDPGGNYVELACRG